MARGGGVKQQKLLLCFLLHFSFFTISYSYTDLTPLEKDLQLLLSFKKLSDPTNSLSTWNLSAPPSSWLGLTLSSSSEHVESRVTRLVLEKLSLSGPSGLSLLTGGLEQLRVLSLKSNSLSGPIPSSSISSLLSLKLLFLSSNLFSGPIPTSLSALTHLYRLDLSHNNLSGPVPTNHLNNLSRLITLRLDSNHLSGSISALNLSALQDFNVSSNSLSGALPPSLSSFPASAFAHNAALCGAPLPTNCTTTKDKDLNVRVFAPKESPPAAYAVVTSSPGSKPESAPGSSSSSSGGKRGGLSRVAVLAIVVGDVAVLLLVSGLLFCFLWRKFAVKKNGTTLQQQQQQGQKKKKKNIVYSSNHEPPYTGTGISSTGGGGNGGGGFERAGKMVFLDREGEKRFELEDLLRASAEMLGKGGHGTTYRAVLEDGSAVAVKRLRELVQIGRREFDGQMEMLGRLRHPNVVPLKAYYYARDEKLLVYDYMPGGSLFSLLHGNRGPGRTPLDWTSRMQIAAGAARSLAFIHHASRSPKLAHGNVKSTNILIDKEGNPRLADFGLALLVLAPHSLTNGYRAPESPLDSRRPCSSQKADVYALGIVLLEILTGKSALEEEVNLPRWVQSVVREEWTAEVFDLELMRYKGIEEEMVAMLQIAMACVAIAPDQRPKIGHVVRVIEEIRGGDLSPSHESFDSVSDSPSASDDARTIGSSSH